MEKQKQTNKQNTEVVCYHGEVHWYLGLHESDWFVCAASRNREI